MAETYITERSAIFELRCSGCKTSWNKREDAKTDLLTLAAGEEVEHHLQTGCLGSVSVREVGYYSGYVESELHRCSIDAERFSRFCNANGSEVEARAVLLGQPMDVVAAAMFVERERQIERESMSSPTNIIVGLGRTAIAGESTANISTQPQVIFKPERLEVPDEIVRDFFLVDLMVGRYSQLVSPGAIPMSMFVDCRHRYLKLDMDTAPISQFITVRVMNTNPNYRYFYGAIVGRRLEITQ